MNTRYSRGYVLRFLSIALLTFLLADVSRVQATITVIDYWRLGENDPSATNHFTPSSTTDIVGAHNLTIQGPTGFIRLVSNPQRLHASSWLALDFFDGFNAFATTPIVATNQDNFGIEAWVNPDVIPTNGCVIAYNGSTATSGWGLIIGSGNYEGLFGGKAIFGTAAAQSGVWTHVALVRASGVSTIYVNGAPDGTAPNVPNLPDGNFALAAPPQSPTGQFFQGFLDEVRVFTFAPGAFSTNDLLWNSKPPSNSLGATSLIVGPNSGSANVVIGSGPIYGPWTAQSSDSWIHINPADSFNSGNGTVNFSFDANPGGTRTTVINVGNGASDVVSFQDIFVTQAGSTYVAAQPAVPIIQSNAPVGGMAVDGADNILGINSNGDLLAYVASFNFLPSTLSSGFNVGSGHPALDSANDIFVADTLNNRVVDRLSAINNSNTVTGGILPVGGAVDPQTNYYFYDEVSANVETWGVPTGVVSNFFSTSTFGPISAISLDAATNVYLCTQGTIPRVVVRLLDGSVTLLPVSPGPVSDGAVDGSGNVYYTTSSEGLSFLLKWSPAAGSGTTLVTTNKPLAGVAVDANENVFYGVASNSVIEIPNTFVDPTPKFEGVLAGTDSLPAVLPQTANLFGPFAPTTDQPWLSIIGTGDGTVSFHFTANTNNLPRIGHINLLGQNIQVTQDSVPPIVLSGLTASSGGVVQFTFTSVIGASFTVLTSTNAALPLNEWTPVGAPVMITPGTYQFFSTPTPDVKRFYTVRFP